jgi:hypothetical protein
MGLFVPNVATDFLPKTWNQQDPFAESAGAGCSSSILREPTPGLKIPSKKSSISSSIDLTEAWPDPCRNSYFQFANLTARIVPQI